MNRSIVLFAALLSTPITISAADDKTHWDYEGPEGPENWGVLAPEFDMCSRGKNQSPINLVAAIHADLPELVFDYRHTGIVQERNTGHAIQENLKPDNFLIFSGERFELKQFHFHSPSEHLVGGRSFPMEIHLVHQNEQGSYAVVGLLFEEGERNELMDRLPSFRRQRGEDPYGDPIDYNELITDRGDYFLYNGSLTTPPCTEGVRWFVIKQPIIASPDQIQHYHDLLGFDNNRPIQEDNSRLVLD